MGLIERMRDYCILHNIHEVCLTCRKACVQPYTRWSGCMPPDEYCEDFEEHDLWTLIFTNLKEDAWEEE